MKFCFITYWLKIEWLERNVQTALDVDEGTAFDFPSFPLNAGSCFDADTVLLHRHVGPSGQGDDGERRAAVLGAWRQQRRAWIVEDPRGAHCHAGPAPPPHLPGPIHQRPAPGSPQQGSAGHFIFTQVWPSSQDLNFVWSNFKWICRIRWHLHYHSTWISLI